MTHAITKREAVGDERRRRETAPDGPCRAQVLDLLFEGRAPGENRIEALLDRIEAHRGRGDRP